MKIIFSDEAHFDLGGYVNKQNCGIWGTENPHAYIEKTTSHCLVQILVQIISFILPSTERMWLCIRLNNAGKWACDRLTDNADFGKKKSSFQIKLILILAGML